MKLQNTKTILKNTARGWSEDKAPKLAAALAYYTVFSLAPLLLIFIGIAGIIFKNEGAQHQIMNQVSSLVGPQAAETVGSMIESAGQHNRGVIATAIGIVSMFFGASGVFGELQDSINVIWKADQKKHSGILAYIKDRFLSFTMVLGVGFLLTVSLILSAAIGAFSESHGGDSNFLWEGINFVVSFGLVALLFTLIFKVLPDQKLTWRDTWLGGILTAFLFTIGKSLLGFYLGKSSVASSYGAAGSVVLLLLWVYYTAQILFIGVEFTKAYAQTSGSKLAILK